MKRLAWGIVLLGTFHAWGQTLPQLTLSDAVRQGLQQGPQSAILANVLSTSRLTVEAAQAHRLFAMTGNLNYGLSDSAGDALEVARTNPILPPLTTASGYGASGTTLSNTPLPQTMSGTLSAASAGTAVSTTASRTFQKNTDGSSTDYGALGVNLSQTVWDGYPGGQSQATVDSDQIQYENAILTDRANRISQVFGIEQAYYNLASAQENLDLLKKTLEQRQKQYDIVKINVQVSKATQVDLEQAAANLHSAQVGLESGQVSLQVARMTLSALIGRPEDAQYQVVSPPMPTLPVSTYQQAWETALAHRVEPKEFALSRQAALLNKTLVLAQNGITATVTGGMNYGFDLYRNTSAVTFTAGAKIGLPTIDAGATSLAAKISDEQVALSQLQTAQWKANLTATLTNDWNQVIVKKKNWDVAVENAQVLQKLLDVAEIQWRMGTNTLSNYLTAEVYLTNGQLATLSAKIAAQLAVLQLMQDMGIEEKL